MTPAAVLAAMDRAAATFGITDDFGGEHRAALFHARAAVAGMVGALERIRDYEGDPRTPIKNSVKKSSIARAALAKEADCPPVCWNCDTALPKGCGGVFKGEGSSCALNRTDPQP